MTFGVFIHVKRFLPIVAHTGNEMTTSKLFQTTVLTVFIMIEMNVPVVFVLPVY